MSVSGPANRSRLSDGRAPRAPRRASDRRRQEEVDRARARRTSDSLDGFEAPGRTAKTDRFLAFIKAYLKEAGPKPPEPEQA
jgi:hypothetical protein